MTLNLPRPQQIRFDDTVDALSHLIRTDGEPSQGGEQHYNRAHLYDLGKYHIPQIIAAQDNEPAALINLALLSAAAIFLDLMAYKAVKMEDIRRIHGVLKPYYSAPAVRVVERPATMTVAKPALNLRSTVAAILGQDLNCNMRDVEKALEDLEEAGYIVVRKN